MQEMLVNRVTRVHKVVKYGFSISNHFCVSVSQHWNRSVWIHVDEWCGQVLFCQSVHLNELYVGLSYLANSEQGSGILAEVITPDFEFLGARRDVL